MKKQTKVLLAAAMMTLGATFSSMAALKNGTWVLNEDGWQYANKEGDYESEVWALSYGTEYWVNEDAILGASEWVEEGSHTYYVQSDGSKAKNVWKYLYDKNDDEEIGDQYWYYFDAKGRMVDDEAKFQIGDKYYYFDANGHMLTGWVSKAGKVELDAATAVEPGEVAYCDPESGAVVRNSWVNAFPWTEAEDDCYEGDDEAWYYTDGNGTPRNNTTRSIDGLKYAFGTDGKMLTKWVVKNNAGQYVNPTAQFDANTVTEIYYCDADYGYAKTASWRKLDNKADKSFWYYFDKTGKAFMATGSNAELTTATRMSLENGETGALASESNAFVTESKKIDGTYYYFNDQGEMFDGLVDINGKLMFLADGARKSGKVTLTDDNENDYTFCFADETDAEKHYEKYVAVTGNFDGYLYNNGQLVTAVDTYAKVTVGTKEYIVDTKGAIQHSTTKEYTLDDGSAYKAKDDHKKFDKTEGAYRYSLIAE